MKKIKLQMSRKQLIWGITALVSLIIGLILAGLRIHMTDGLLTQKMADRWSNVSKSAQISCFFAESAQITEESLQQFEYNLNKGLEEASIVSESENEGARLWADAYSAKGTVTLESDRAKVDVTAIGIGGDFFLFHPVTLKSGTYFSGNDLMQDHVIIDEQAAWQLFGSNDVVGMTVYIGNVPHIVTGVVRRPQGRMEKAAGLTSTVVYVSYETLEAYGTNNGINHYEIVMPNPVDEFAYGKVKEGIGIDEKNVEIVENSRRYSLPNRIKTILAFGTRSMNGKAIIYPYWENLARGYEDIIALLTVFMLFLLLFPVVTVIWCFVHWWRHKGWTLKDVWHTGKDKAERAVERRREKKHPHKERDVLEELERELEEDPYADSEFSWLTDEPAEGAETKEEQQS